MTDAELHDQKYQHKVLFDQRVILIKPTVDASDKELHKRNDMLNAEKNLRLYLNDKLKKAPFVPTQLGQLSKFDNGVKANVIVSKFGPSKFDEI